MEAKKLVETEEQAEKEEDLGRLGKVGELEKAREMLEGYCDSNAECVECMYYTANSGCRVGCPAIWENLTEGEKPEPEADEGKSENNANDNMRQSCPVYGQFGQDGICDCNKKAQKLSTSPAEKRKRVLDDAIDAVCRDRCEMYGEAEDNFGVIAELWNAYLNAGLPEGACKVDLGAKRVAEMMILFKVGRAATAMEDHRDTYVDIAGYAACAGGGV